MHLRVAAGVGALHDAVELVFLFLDSALRVIHDKPLVQVALGPLGLLALEHAPRHVGIDFNLQLLDLCLLPRLGQQRVDHTLLAALDGLKILR